MQSLAMGLKGFVQDLGDRMRNVTVVVMSEFGRRIVPNDSAAPTTAEARRCLLSVAAFAAAKSYGHWPGLATGSRRTRQSARHDRLPRRAGGNRRSPTEKPGHRSSLPGTQAELSWPDYVMAGFLGLGFPIWRHGGRLSSRSRAKDFIASSLPEASGRLLRARLFTAYATVRKHTSPKVSV